MNNPVRIAGLVVLLLATSTACAAVKIRYRITGEDGLDHQPPRVGNVSVTTEIDGASFRITPQYGAVELSSDDGATTFFGGMRAAPQTPLAKPAADASAPIQGSLDDERLVVGESQPGPTMFGVPTRTYTVEHEYAIGTRVVYVFTSSTRYHAHYAITVADIDVSSAAARVALSRGYAYALSQHAEAFTGVPLQIDGTIESGSGLAHRVTRFHVEAETLQR